MRRHGELNCYKPRFELNPQVSVLVVQEPESCPSVGVGNAACQRPMRASGERHSPVISLGTDAVMRVDKR